MKQNLKKMELLAPAGDWDALKAGVAGGADAFYLGGKLFGARQSATNFNLNELKKVADYLHLRGRKMYVTVNTLIKEDEIETALEFLEQLYRIGTDAVIIQDIGLLSLIRKIWPDLEIHASTQMTIMDSAGVRFLQKMGIKRAVLAREVSIKEMANIYLETGMDLEVFVHGALCISYSGACLFSSLIGGRSGNRGRCAQPCRMEYKLLRKVQTGINEVKTEGAHLLSPKDLSLLPYLPEIAASGVKSLKIEGRMKGPEYVGTVVRVYRRALDRMESKPNRFLPSQEEVDTLKMVFNRGFSTGYSFADLGPELMSVTRPSNRGRFLGRVKSYDYKKRRVTVSLEEGLSEGDGIEVWVTKGGRLGTIVEDLKIMGEGMKNAGSGAEVTFALPDPAQPGDRVFLTSSRRNEENIRQMLRNDFAHSRLPCKMKVKVAPGKPLVVVCWDNEGNSVIIHSDDQASVARKRPLTEEVLKEHLTRLGDSPFIVQDFQAEISGEPMLPYGIIHKVRREIVEALGKKRLKTYNQLLDFSYKRRFSTVIEEVHAHAQKKRKGNLRTGKSFFTVYAGNLRTVEVAISLGIKRILVGGEIYRPGFSWNHEILVQAVKKCREAGVEIIIAVPEITRQREREYLLKYLDGVQELDPDAIMVAFPGSLQTVLEETDIPVHLNYIFHTLNSYGVTIMEKKRIKGLTISQELSRNEIEAVFYNISLHDWEIELIVFGTTELMVSQFCPIGAWDSGNPPQTCAKNCQRDTFFLKDRKGIVFPIITDDFCRMHLLNSRDLCLVKEIPDFKERKLGLRLDLRYYSAETAAKIIKIYKEVFAEDDEGEDSRARGWEVVERITGRKLTRGHYYRGVE